MSTKATVVITAQDRTRQAFNRVHASLRKVQSSVSGLLGPLRSLKSILPAIGLAILAKQSIQAAEALRGMDARIRRVTDALGDYNRVQRELYEISQRNGTALTETANLFISINRAAEDLGRGRTEVLQLTDTIQQLGVISGASGEAMKNSLRQFSQAMAGGVVRAEEFNSIIENTPEIAARIAKGMGLTVGQLRLAVVDGKVLSEQVFNSLLSQTKEIEAEFSRMPLTIGRAWQSLKNAMSRFVADANEAGGATEGIANAIKGIADAIDDLNRRVRSGELKAEFALWIELMTDVGSQVDWLKGKLSELVPDGVAFEWGEFFKDLPALLHLTFVDLFAMTDRGIQTIALLWNKLPLLWDSVWIKIERKAREWWATITGIFTDEDILRQQFELIELDYLNQARDVRIEIDKLAKQYGAAIEASKSAAAAIREEQFARMDNRREMVSSAQQAADNIAAWERYEAAMGDMIAATRQGTSATDDLSDAAKNAAGEVKLFTERLDKVGGTISDMQLKTANERLEEMGGIVDGTTESFFDLKEAILDVQRNIQQGFSDLFYDIFSNKGVDSFKDFAKRVLDIFKRLLADMAAAWVASNIFKLPVSFGSGIGGLINGGGIGGGIGQGVGVAGGLGRISSTISGGLGRIVTGLKSIFGGGTATAAGNIGFKGPGAFATGSGGGGIGAAGALVPLGIAAMGFGIQSSRKDARRQLQNQFFTQVGTGITEGLGESPFDFRGQLDAATAFFSTTNAGWQATMKALLDLDVLTKSWGAQLDERGQQLVKVQGDIGGMKTALSEAVATGFDFAGSLEMAIEKGQNMRVSIMGDAEAIETALNAATSMGIGGFRDLETTASGVTATLTGDIALWESYLQGFVTESLRDAINGVGSLGEQAGDATKQFLALASAAAKVRVGATINGGRDVQDAGLPKFAAGGITSGPSIAGEAGPEAIIPLQNGAVPVRIKGDSGETNSLLREANRVLRRIERKPAERAI